MGSGIRFDVTATTTETDDVWTLKQFEDASIQEVYTQLATSAEGIDLGEVEKRQSVYGRNEIEEKQTSNLKRLFGYFWGPIPWMIEIAAVLSLVVRHWPDLIIIMLLLFFNAAVGFWQEYKASNAVAALKKQLALKARVRRNGTWDEADAATLVPGDITRLRLGDIVPADCKLVEGDYLSIDQSALTGESLPTSKKPGAVAYSGSIVKQGEMIAVVVAIGSGTYFGRTAMLVSEAKRVSHFQKAVLNIGDFLIYISIALALILITVQWMRGEDFIELIQFALILTVAAIPVAMPAVLAVTMALGAVALSKRKAIVSRLDSIEEMAGMDILCSDKTGTLTQNKLTLGDPVTLEGVDKEELILAGALASKAEDRDAIDLAVIGGVHESDKLELYHQETFVPFDPVHKRTEAVVVCEQDQQVVQVTKGAPQVVMKLCDLSEAQSKMLDEHVDALARQGYRTLGVARKKGRHTKNDEASHECGWEMLGLLPLFDPPREDSKETIEAASTHGIDVRMVTGDNVAIAKEISEKLGLGANIHMADEYFSDITDQHHIPMGIAERVERSEGFAQVFPEHKFEIVESFQERGHIVGMTGDGVNDAPALKQADIGIAVSGATDAARAAAALVLTAPGLSVIVTAIEEARKIFERMNSYAIYRIIETIRIMFFVVLAMVVFNFYPITAIMIILLALFNDLPIMTIAYDRTVLSPTPVKWDMRRVLTVSTVLGIIGVFETFALLVGFVIWTDFTHEEIQSLIFLKLAVAGHLTLFVARTPNFFLKAPYPAPIVLWAAIVTKALASLLVGFGFGLITPVPWYAIGIVWIYCICWIFIEDIAKLAVYRALGHGAEHHRRLLKHAHARLHQYSQR
ncbi:plasma-membrane proton-efflux P-type ATPase [Poriferisphaera sp. WC338]|uniref:plasma-membrane proton-efflux P-type ATPase n=1 Tax=Poriferisphaera sp. WC338 TaxID=3425129 RepID=UPI003D816EB7